MHWLKVCVCAYVCVEREGVVEGVPITMIYFTRLPPEIVNVRGCESMTA